MENKIITISTGQTFGIVVVDKYSESFTDLLYRGYYDNRHITPDLLEYPYRPAIEKKLKDDILTNFVGTSAQINAEIAKCKDKAKELQEIAMADYLLIYPNREQEFKNDMFEYFDVVNNPKAEKAFSIAYQKGHSSGYAEIYNEFSELVELIK